MEHLNKPTELEIDITKHLTDRLYAVIRQVVAIMPDDMQTAPILIVALAVLLDTTERTLADPDENYPLFRNMEPKARLQLLNVAIGISLARQRKAKAGGIPLTPDNQLSPQTRSDIHAVLRELGVAG